MLTRFKRRHKNYWQDKGVALHPITYPKYEPASWQTAEFHASDKDIRALFGGDRAGKTEAGSYELLTMMRQHPGDLFWAGAMTFQKIRPLWQKHKKYLNPREIAKVSWARYGEQIPEYLRLTNGSELFYKTYKSGPGVWSAESVRGIHLDEDPMRVSTFGEQIYNDCLSRIIDCDGRLWVTATPVLGKNWMYYRLFKRNVDNREDHTPDPDIQTWTVSLLDNKFVDDVQKRKAKGRMSKDEIQRRFYGLFTSLEGAVFKEWREDLSVLQDFPKLPPGIRKAVGIDLGYDHPFVCEWGGVWDEAAYMYDEYYKRETLMKFHAAEILRREKDYRFFKGTAGWVPLEARLCDHERQTRAELDNQLYDQSNHTTIGTEPAKKDIDESIQVLNRLMMPREDTGLPRFFVSPECHHLIRTLGSCHFKPQRAGSDEKETIADVDKDPVDACRYWTLYFFGGDKTDYNIETA